MSILQALIQGRYSKKILIIAASLILQNNIIGTYPNVPWRPHSYIYATDAYPTIIGSLQCKKCNNEQILYSNRLVPKRCPICNSTDIIIKYDKRK